MSNYRDPQQEPAIDEKRLIVPVRVAVLYEAGDWEPIKSSPRWKRPKLMKSVIATISIKWEVSASRGVVGFLFVHRGSSTKMRNVHSPGFGKKGSRAGEVKCCTVLL